MTRETNFKKPKRLQLFPPGKLQAKFYKLEFNHMSTNNNYHIDTSSMLNRGNREQNQNLFQRDLFHSSSHSIKVSWLVTAYNEVMENRQNNGLKWMTVNEDLSQLENTNTINPQQSKQRCRMQLLVQGGMEREAKSSWKTKKVKENWI